jgi:hypothetical protein
VISEAAKWKWQTPLIRAIQYWQQARVGIQLAMTSIFVEHPLPPEPLLALSKVLHLSEPCKQSNLITHRSLDLDQNRGNLSRVEGCA